MTCSTSPIHHSSSSPSFQVITPSHIEQPDVEQSLPQQGGNGDAWELFSAEARLNVRLQPDFTASIEKDREVVLNNVTEIFNHPVILCTRNTATEKEILCACDMLLTLSSDDRETCLVQLRSLTQGHLNCNFWLPRDMLDLLAQLVAMPFPRVRQETCVAYLNQAIRETYMHLLSGDVIRAFKTLRFTEECIYRLSLNPETFPLFLQLLPFHCWPGSQWMEDARLAIVGLFPNEAHKTVQCALILSKNSRCFDAMYRILSVLHQTPQEERDSCMECLQKVRCDDWSLDSSLWAWKFLTELSREDRAKCAYLIPSVIKAPWKKSGMV